MANYLSVYKPFTKETQIGRKEKALDFTHEGQASERKKALTKKPINKVSAKHLKELAKRKKLKAELIEESGGLCQICGKEPDFRGLDLIHKKALSAGGKTNRKNCLVGCQKCHNKEYHHIEETEP